MREAESLIFCLSIRTLLSDFHDAECPTVDGLLNLERALIEMMIVRIYSLV